MRALWWAGLHYLILGPYLKGQMKVQVFICHIFIIFLYWNAVVPSGEQHLENINKNTLKNISKDKIQYGANVIVKLLKRVKSTTFMVQFCANDYNAYLLWQKLLHQLSHWLLPDRDMFSVIDKPFLTVTITLGYRITRQCTWRSSRITVQAAINT